MCFPYVTHLFTRSSVPMVTLLLPYQYPMFNMGGCSRLHKLAVPFAGFSKSYSPESFPQKIVRLKFPLENPCREIEAHITNNENIFDFLM